MTPERLAALISELVHTLQAATLNAEHTVRATSGAAADAKAVVGSLRRATDTLEQLRREGGAR